MALDLTAYATAAEYRNRNDRSSTNSDALLDAYLLAISRVMDRRLGYAPGMFKPQTSIIYYVTSYGGTRLRLRDERGEQLLLRTASAIGIDSELDATYDGFTLVLGTDAWVRGYPVNAATNGEPYTALDLLPGVANADPVEWDTGEEVRITGNWGWAATPGAVKERVIGITRELVEMHVSGGAGVLQDINTAIEMNGNARALMYLLEQEYSVRLPI